MSDPRIGWVAADAEPERLTALRERVEVVDVGHTGAAVAAAVVDGWCVLTPGLDPQVLQAIRDGETPALFLVDPAEARSWHRVLKKGVHDVAWLPAQDGELRARMLGLLARRGTWNHVSSSLCREIAHDLRGPLQALTFTVAALRNDGAVSDAFAEDVDALLEATDVADLMLDGVSNLGRTASPVTATDAAVDVTQLVRHAAERKAYGGRVTVESGEPLVVRAKPDAIRSAVEDVVRVTWIRAAGGRRVSVQCMRFGDEVVVTAQARAYDALLEHLPALMWRERPVLLRRDRVPLPLAGLAYAREVARACGGDLSARRQGQDLQVELRLPLA
ncbi:MAG: HAMP domain-containing histidine kinase [Alphaproteobacteria bacterium]|nr:HAMP domain-containing histidine kinase [Alphaproteobacteria bacterium]